MDGGTKELREEAGVTLPSLDATGDNGIEGSLYEGRSSSGNSAQLRRSFSDTTRLRRSYISSRS